MAKELSTHKITVKVQNLKSLDSYATKVDKIAARLKKLIAVQEKRIQKGRTHTKAFEKTAKSIEYNTNRLNKLTGATQKNTAATQKNNASKTKSAQSSKMAASALSAMGLSIAGAVMALKRLTTFMINNVKVFAEFERGVKNVTTLMNADDTGMFRGSLFEGSLQLSRDFGFALNDVNKAMFNSVSAGISGGQAIQFLNDASKLAVAGVTNLKSATLGLTTVINAYGLEAKDAARISEVLFTTQKFGVTTVEELSKSLGVVVPFAAASGISIEELGAAIAVTTRSGLDAAKTVTALRAAISQMQKPAAESRDLFIEYGIPIGAAQMKAIGFTETLRRLNKAYQDSPRAIEQMFGNVRGLTAIFSLAGDNAQEYTDILEELDNATLTAANLQKALEENMDSAAMNIDKLSTAWTNLKVAMGQSNWMIDTVKDLTDFLNILGSDGVSGLDKFSISLMKLGNLFGLMPSVTGSLAIDIAQSEALRDSYHSAGMKAIKGFEAGFEKQYQETGDKISLLEITARGDMGVMNLTPTDFSAIDAIVAQGDMIDAIDLKRLEGAELRQAKWYQNALAKFRDYNIEYAAISKENEEDAQAKADAEDKAKAEAEMAYQKLERELRLGLSDDIKDIQEEALKNNEDIAVTELKIAKAKFASLRKLRDHQIEHQGHTLKEEVSLIERMNKLEMDIKKKQQQLDMSNSEAYNAEKLRMEKVLFDKKAKITKLISTDNEDERISQLEAQRRILVLEKKHFEDLKRIGGEAARKASPQERQTQLENVTNTEIKLNKLKFDEEMKLEKLKQQTKMMGVNAITEALQLQAQVSLSNAEKEDQRRLEALQERYDQGKISEKALDRETEKIEKRAFERKKRADKGAVMLNYITELSSIARNAAANLANAATMGAAGAAQYKIQAGLATARMLVNVAAIDAQQFAKGGMVYGKSHAHGGEKFAVGGRVVELEGGEAVINKRSAAMFRNELSAMNVAGGGVSFMSRLTDPFGLGRFAQRKREQINYELMAKLIGENTNVVLPVENFNEVQNRVKSIEDGSRY